jgi:hypothetical protein
MSIKDFTYYLQLEVNLLELEQSYCRQGQQQIERPELQLLLQKQLIKIQLYSLAARCIVVSS